MPLPGRAPARRALAASTAAVLGFAAVLGVEVTLARGTARLEEPRREDVDGRVGRGRDPLRVAWIGDSTSAGVGATQPENVLPVLVAKGLGVPVDLTVLSVSGARVSDAVAEQLPRLPEARPDWVFVGIGSNDVTHLTPRRQFRRQMDALLEGVRRSGARTIVVLGIGQFAATPLFAQPLRFLAGVRGRVLDAEVRAAAAAHRATYVPIREATGARFVSDPARYHARDRFHPSDDGYALWATATLDGVRRSGATLADPRP